jgi:nucleoside-diphosphate-sugar epimerase
VKENNMQKVLITGNMGYVGPGVVKQLRENYPGIYLMGFDIGYFARNLTTTGLSPESFLNVQYFGDIRNFPESILHDVDTIVHLAAISNDPIGNKYEEVTFNINYKASVDLAVKAKKAGVKKFVFASSCSIYGAAGESARDENAQLNPLTAYAKSKVKTEQDLQELSDDDFNAICLRFATACGMSDRLRLDLVLNDFIASAYLNKEITILSDGTPWRPLINVRDMARAIEWACTYFTSDPFLAINVGSSQWNYQVKSLAEKVAELIPGTRIDINKNASPDKRSYQVNFDKFEQMAPKHIPQYDLTKTIAELISGLKAIDFNDHNFRKSRLMRLNELDYLRDKEMIDANLQVQF